MTIYIRLW